MSLSVGSILIEARSIEGSEQTCALRIQFRTDIHVTHSVVYYMNRYVTYLIIFRLNLD